MRWTDAMVREALGLETSPSDVDVAYETVRTDTRALESGSLFVALRGERFDAHEFLAAAAEAGARGAVVERIPDEGPTGLVYYRVGDSLEALGRLARYRRRRLDARVCAVAGANGKTSTKELARTVLATRFRVHATTGNLNNLVGTPLTLLGAPDDAEALVVEIGTNAPGEVATLRDIVEPDAAIVTNVSEEHLEGLGSLEGVLAEETSILEAIGDGPVIVGDEPPELAARARRMASRVRVAGMTERADGDLRAEDVRLDEDGRVSFRWRGREVRSGYRGRHNATNALLALALGEAWGVSLDAAVGSLAAMVPQKMRMEIHRYGALRVVADCYNANPSSLRSAVDLLASLPAGSGRVAVVGTMKELGAESDRLHREAAEGIVAAGVDQIVATGAFVPAFEPLAERLGSRLIRVDDPMDAFDALAARLEGDEVVLLKGSRGVALERLLPKFEARFGAEANGAAPSEARKEA